MDTPPEHDDRAFDDMPIIGRPRGEPVDPCFVRAGSSSGFRTDLRWDGDSGLTGSVNVFFGPETIWSSGELGPSAWPPLLARLALAWPVLRSGSVPTTILGGGAHGGEVVIEREDDEAKIVAGGRTFRWHLGDVLHTLTVAGDGMASRIAAETGDRLGSAVLWKGRERS